MTNKMDKVRYLIKDMGSTFLGAGPMSLTTTNIIIDLANLFQHPISLIPSRRQVECAELGGGYVENWTTEDFAEHVRDRDKGNFVLLSRDHCGPWQIPTLNQDGKQKTLKEEMDSVKVSLSADIQSGFEIIHIDPSLALQHGYTKSDVQEIAYEMIAFCESVASGPLYYEIGTEEQGYASTNVTDSMEELDLILATLKKRNLPIPMFYVQQTGTKVQELRNVGNFDNDIDAKKIMPASVNIPMVVAGCEKRGIWLKEHNADYLSDMAISWHTRYGIHATNVAPEFGVTETQALLSLAHEIGSETFIKDFSEKVAGGMRWEKWMIPNSISTESDRVQIAGHYHFSEEWCRSLRFELYEDAKSKGINPESYVSGKIKNSLLRYLQPFGYGNR
jgi:hypothetical protein